MAMNPVIHFEMPYEDAARVNEFYAKCFGWQITLTGPDMGNYILAATTESDDKGPKKPGAINGGFFPKANNPAQHPMIVIQVPDIKLAMEQVTQAGGKVQGEPVEIPQIGWYVSFIDTEGNRLSMLQPPKE